MALRQWSSEIYTAEFRELQASTFCCSRDGRLGLLAGAISSMSVVFFHHSTSGCLKPSLIFKYFHQEGEVLAFSVWSSPTNWWDEPQGAAGDFFTFLFSTFTFTFFCWPLSVPTNSPQMGGGRWPMEPKPAVWKPHRSLLQRQGELQCSSCCKTIFQEKRSDNKSFIHRWRFTSGRRVTL